MSHAPVIRFHRDRLAVNTRHHKERDGFVIEAYSPFAIPSGDKHLFRMSDPGISRTTSQRWLIGAKPQERAVTEVPDLRFILHSFFG